MNRLNISTRLAVAFGAMVLLLVVMGGVSLLRSASQRTALNDVLQTRIPITRSMGVLADGVNVQAIQFRNLALTTSEEIVKRSIDQIATSRTSVARQMETLTALI
jgi:phosphoglycerate-specific signal transduction histidine kinase